MLTFFFSALFRSHQAQGVHFLVVYIAEAHARDQWPVGKTISCVDQPTTLEQRLNNARQCQDTFKFEMPMLVDGMDNTFHEVYGCWPFRFYVIDQGKLVLKAEPNSETFYYDVNELDQWINRFIQSNN